MIETPLCKLAYKYGTDKCPKIKHSFTPFYYNLFKDKQNNVKKILELGVGSAGNMKHSKFYRIGASLYMWRDFFPNAQIFGADILPGAIFKENRIETFLCDETKKDHLVRLIQNTGSDIDIFIDDGSHAKNHQVFLARTVLPLLKKDVIYIIEDVVDPNYISENLKDYDCKTIVCSGRWGDDKLVVVKRKENLNSMKNIMIFVNPDKKFTGYYDALVKIQIDNSYRLGWKKQDIVLVTNFKYQYDGIKSLVIEDENFCKNRPLSTKTTTVPLLIKMGVINNLCWVHDFDAYQLIPFNEEELDMENFDMGVTDYGWRPRLSLGVIFVKKEALDIFEHIKKGVYWRSEYDNSVSSEDESILKMMMRNNVFNIQKRCKKLNITYNFGFASKGRSGKKRNEEQYKKTNKPLRVLHFHPNDKWRLRDYMYGTGYFNKRIMPKELIKIFHSHGIK